MAKLYFYYGAMGASKTANALMAEYNYSERGKKVLLGKTDADVRDGEKIIKSRIGLQKECYLLSEICSLTKEDLIQYDAVIVDEIQFATAEQIDFLAKIVDTLDIPVLCYGLRSNFKNNLFEGSERLMAIADEIKEIKTICWCGKKAICNVRYKDNHIIKDGPEILVGGNESYVALCRKHYMEGKIHP